MREVAREGSAAGRRGRRGGRKKVTRGREAGWGEEMNEEGRRSRDLSISRGQGNFLNYIALIGLVFLSFPQSIFPVSGYLPVPPPFARANGQLPSTSRCRPNLFVVGDTYCASSDEPASNPICFFRFDVHAVYTCHMQLSERL